MTSINLGKTKQNHGYESQSKLWKYFAASCGFLYPPLRGIVQLTNSVALCFRNWSFNNKFKFFHFIFHYYFSFLSTNMYVFIVQDVVITCPRPLTSFLSPMEISEILMMRGNLATFSKKETVF